MATTRRQSWALRWRASPYQHLLLETVLGCVLALLTSGDETVASVRVLVEELRLPAGIPLPVLGEEDTVRVIRPPRAGTSHISGPKGLWKITAGDGAADLVH
jgi:hypothetical protein